ncbi:hypothetical protein QBC34DRAFT_470967 [Podospora aff. communis PSN243]|uniref:Uncharacterized protein n=1 Tax=Podospora aff. communis PSN243 TaxID=3040156 RepID=A0AAV9H5A0_9PEZI|nr:hypothetical protein QBC34DRAFT_470967 [Podospora aff. communis PSN243]
MATRLENVTNLSPTWLRQALWPQCNNHCASDQPYLPQGPELLIGGRGERLGRYHQYYTALVKTYAAGAPSEERLLTTHEGLFTAIAQLKANPRATKDEFCRLAFPRDDDEPPHDPVHLAQAVSLVVRVMLMIEPSTMHYLSYRLEKGTLQVRWKADVPFCQYISDLFPAQNDPIPSHARITSKLRATKLKESGVSFQPTHDIRNHLHFDREEYVLEIFHHTAFLKEQLRATKTGGNFSDPCASLAVGALPRQLVLELLHSVQIVLFALDDPESKDSDLLSSLVQSCGLDPDVLNFEFDSIRNFGEEHVPFVYLSARLSDLYREMENPAPRGWLGRVTERRSGARYMMMATLVGVIFAVFLGMLSLAVSSYQTWIAYQAWQHPISPGQSR